MFKSAFRGGGRVTMALQDNLIARTTAGRAAVAIVHENDPEVGSDMLRGMLSGFLVACGEVNGWDDTLRIVHELARQARAHEFVGKPKLQIVKAEVA